MGGHGSTRWGRHTRRTRVEECRALDIRDLTKVHALQGRHALGTAEFPQRLGEEFPFRIHFEIEPLKDGSHGLTLTYLVLQKGSWETVTCAITVRGTSPFFGGIRWWFICPCTVNCRVCARRVRKLYLPPGERYFGCRHCHDLTYRSVQEHDKRIGYLMRHPSIMLDRIKRGSPDMLTRRAYTEWFNKYLLNRLD